MEGLNNTCLNGFDPKDLIENKNCKDIQRSNITRFIEAACQPINNYYFYGAFIELMSLTYIKKEEFEKHLVKYSSGL